MTRTIVETAQGTFCLDLTDISVSRPLSKRGYGLHEIARVKQLIDGDARVLVVGAHVGAIAIPVSKACRELIAIEANPDTFEMLHQNIQLNGCANVIAHNVAANHCGEPMQFVMNTQNSGGSKRMPKIRAKEYFHDNPKIVTVRGVRLDDLCEGDFDLVFMDIEGSEYFAFLGMQRILARARTLIVEFIPHHLQQVAGVSVAEFLRPVALHFDRLTIPSTGVTADRDGFAGVLQAMVDRRQSDEGIVFEKRRG